jgi:transcriptional regulator GlxA family with amidase domain
VRRLRRIGIIAYEGVQALDLIGPLDVFSAANAAAGQPSYQCIVLGIKKGACAAESGLRILPDVPLDRAPMLDTVVIPGGASLRLNARLRATVANWIRRRHRRLRRIASVCTGIYPLAESGLIDGRSATTHWRFAEDVAARWPAVRLDSNAIFIRDDRFYTSAGITAGIDLSLALVEEDLGNRVALAVARELVVYFKRSGGQLQYSEPLRAQTLGGGFSDIVAWMQDNLSSDLSVDSLADRMHWSARHFSRKFRTALGLAPAEFVTALRLDEARWLLVNGDLSIEDVAGTVGYGSADAFRRAFERRFGIAPSEYRSRFPSLLHGSFEPRHQAVI